jgi:cytochrome c biogenesis protein CcmG, thiol:disulfide interchange protein DsbE
LLIKDVVESYKGRAEFVSENWGESKLAERYGVKRYPVVFVGDVLVAQPDDFGWYGAQGKYTPWRERPSHERFQRDLRGMIDLALAGRTSQLAAEHGAKIEGAEVASLPAFAAKDLEGRAVESKQLAGRVVVVEFWATWCPPCRSTLGFLGDLKRRHDERVVVVAVAVESKETDVREMVKPLGTSVNFVMGTEELAAPFGTLGSVPRMFVFDPQGRTAAVFYGAPPDLHDKVEGVIKTLVKQ